MTQAWPKPSRPVVSKPIRDSAKGMPCAVRWSPECDGSESTILAHIRGVWSGQSQKPNDTMAVYACFHCHDALDGRRGGPVPPEEILRALAETQQAMLDAGLLTVRGVKCK
jgi:hypothetical protein